MASNTGTIAVTVTIGEKRVTLEGPESFVRQEVQRLTDLVASSVVGRAGTVDRSTPAVPDSVTEANLVSLKRPSNHSETVAVLAFCLKRNGTDEFDEDEMRRAYLRARVRPPKVVAQAIRDAKNVFDYIETGSKRGFFRLSHFGETTVEFDLPRESGHRG